MFGHLVENPEYQNLNPEQIPKIEESIPDDPDIFLEGCKNCLFDP
jgi:hypothetical protein